MNKQYDSRTADKFVVRLPDGLRAQVEQSASASDTSMNTVFIQALRQHLDSQGRQQLLLDALAAAYVRAGEKEHDLRFQLHDREGSRRDWFDEAQRLQAQLAERDALLEDWYTANATGEVKVSDKAYRIVTRTATALSASAEPGTKVEAVAKEIYESWADRPGFTPWVDGGNSLKQDEARSSARAQLNAEQATEGASHE